MERGPEPVSEPVPSAVPGPVEEGVAERTVARRGLGGAGGGVRGSLTDFRGLIEVLMFGEGEDLLNVFGALLESFMGKEEESFDDDA
jgi:hypothetical protein